MGGYVIGRILVVDDDEDMRDVCSEILSVAGYSVEAVSDGAFALHLMSMDWDLVITDLQMPELDGWSLYDAAIRKSPRLRNRFLFMTGEREAATELLAIGLPCVVKPFRIREFLLKVDEMMARSLEEPSAQESRRLYERFSLDSGCGVASQDDVEITARVEDISRLGMKIRYQGRPLSVTKYRGASVKIDSWNILRQATMVWSKPMGIGALSGFRFLDPIPASSIMSIMHLKNQ